MSRQRVRRGLSAAVVAGLCAAGLWAQTARASDVDVFLTVGGSPQHGFFVDSYDLYYTADPGEANAATIRAATNSNNPLEIRDVGAAIRTHSTAGATVPYPTSTDGSAGCSASGHYAYCSETDSPMGTVACAAVEIPGEPCHNFVSGFPTVGIDLGDGNDTLTLGFSTLPSGVYSGVSVQMGDGDDVVNAVDGASERIDCGNGADTAMVDASDQVATNCENVTRGS